MIRAILYLIIFTSILSCSSDKSTPENNVLVGSWKLVAFVNESNGTMLNPEDFDDSNEITIRFKEDYKFDGLTGLNEFSGEYSINKSSQLLIFNDVNLSFVSENDWGNLFFDSLYLNYNLTTSNYENNIKLSDNILKLYYSENEYMRFEKM
jgi:hypothetical protein